MTDELDKLLEEYSGAYLKYPEPRRVIESKLMTAIVAEIKALKASRIIDTLPRVPNDVLAAHAVDLEKKIEAFVAENKAKRGPGRPAKEAV